MTIIMLSSLVFISGLLVPGQASRLVFVVNRRLGRFHFGHTYIESDTQRITPLMRRRIAHDQWYRCGECWWHLPFTWEMDHIQARCLGGTNRRANLVMLCSNCHTAKTSNTDRSLWVRQKKKRGKNCMGPELEESSSGHVKRD